MVKLPLMALKWMLSNILEIKYTCINSTLTRALSMLCSLFVAFA
jgi:hypothetical protein